MSITTTTRSQMPRRTRAQKIKDRLLYVGIAVLIVISVGIFATHQARTGGSPNLPLKWFGFTGMTAIVFGNAIRAHQRSWRRRKFWLFLALFFAVHSGLGVLALLRAPVVPLVLYAVLAGPEYVVLAMSLGYFLNQDK